MPDFSYRRVVLHDDYLHLLPFDQGHDALVGTILDFSLDVKLPGLFKWPPRVKPVTEIGMTWASRGIVGSRDEMLHSCLLDWGRAVSKGEPNAYWGQVVSRVTGLPNDRTYEQWVQWHLDQNGWSDQSQWKIAALQTGNPFLIRTVLRGLKARPAARFEPALAEIIDDAQKHPYVRTGCIDKIHRGSTAAMWRALVNAVGDTAVRKELTFRLPKDHPQRDLIRFIETNQAKEGELWSKAHVEVEIEKAAPKTVGEYALKRLKKLTGQDFGQDKQVWRQWIERHYSLSLQAARDVGREDVPQM